MFHGWPMVMLRDGGEKLAQYIYFSRNRKTGFNFTRILV